MIQRILPQKELAVFCTQAKNAGKKVIFTNGVFDFLHAGHVTYLEQARDLGDLLVVGMNSDASTRAIKGEGRPVNKEQDRAKLLSALRCVDYVCIFEETTAEETIKVIQPHIYVKGGDYESEKMPETPVVRAYGGEVVILPFVAGYSNSSQFSKIKELEEKEDAQRAAHIA